MYAWSKLYLVHMGYGRDNVHLDRCSSRYSSAQDLHISRPSCHYSLFVSHKGAVLHLGYTQKGKKSAMTRELSQKMIDIIPVGNAITTSHAYCNQRSTQKS